MFCSSRIRQEAKIRPFRSSLKSMCELIRRFKKNIHSNFVNAMKDIPFGVIFLAFYNKDFGKERTLKSNTSVPKIE